VGLAFTNTSKLANYTIPPTQEAVQRKIELYTPLHIIREAYSLCILSEDLMVIPARQEMLK